MPQVPGGRAIKIEIGSFVVDGVECGDSETRWHLAKVIEAMSVVAPPGEWDYNIRVWNVLGKPDVTAERRS